MQSSIKIEGTLYFDGAIVTGPKKFYQIVKTKDECRPATYTLPTPNPSATQNYYIGRTTEFVWDAFTIAPSHCTITYKIDQTVSGPFGAKFANFVVDQATRKITIAAAGSWASGDKKDYTIPINIQYTTSVSDSTLIDLNPAQTYNYVIKVQDDPCESNPPTQYATTQSEVRKQTVTLLGSSAAEFSYAMAFSIDIGGTVSTTACTTKNYAVVYGDGTANDITNKLNTDNYLTLDTATNMVKISATTPVSKAGSAYKIYVTGKTGVGSIAIPADRTVNGVTTTNGNRLTIELTLVDPCLTATTAFTAVADTTYVLGAAAVDITWAAATITPSACTGAPMNVIRFDQDYTSTIPAVLTATDSTYTTAAVVKTNNVSANTGWKYTVNTSNPALVGTHEIKVGVTYSGTALNTPLTIKLIIKDPCDDATVTKVTPAKIEYVLNAAEKSVTFAKWETNPSNCKDKIKLKLTIPTDASGIVSYTENDRTLKAKTGTAACTVANNCIKEHELTLGAYGPSGTLLNVATPVGTTSAVKFKLEIKAAAPTAPKKPQKSGESVGKNLINIFGNAAQTIGAGMVATGGAQQTFGRAAGSRAGRASFGGSTSGKGVTSLDGSATGTISAGEGGKKGPAPSGEVGVDTSVDASTEVTTDGETNFDADTESEVDFGGVDFGNL